MNTDSLDAFVRTLIDEIVAVVASTVTEAIAAAPTAEPWRLLSAEEAGHLLGRSARWVYAASQVGGPGYLRLPYVLVGSRQMYDPEALKRWAQERQIPAEMPAESSQTRRTPGNRALSRRQRIPNPAAGGAGRR